MATTATTLTMTAIATGDAWVCDHNYDRAHVYDHHCGCGYDHDFNSDRDYDSD